MNIFTSDEALARLQREALRADVVKGAPIDNGEARREYLANQRERREQARWRSAACLVIAVPAVVAVVTAVLQWAAAALASGAPTP